MTAQENPVEEDLEVSGESPEKPASPSKPTQAQVANVERPEGWGKTEAREDSSVEGETKITVMIKVGKKKPVTVYDADVATRMFSSKRPNRFCTIVDAMAKALREELG